MTGIPIRFTKITDDAWPVHSFYYDNEEGYIGINLSWPGWVFMTDDAIIQSIITSIPHEELHWAIDWGAEESWKYFSSIPYCFLSKDDHVVIRIIEKHLGLPDFGEGRQFELTDRWERLKNSHPLDYYKELANEFKREAEGVAT